AVGLLLNIRFIVSQSVIIGFVVLTTVVLLGFRVEAQQSRPPGRSAAQTIVPSPQSVPAAELPDGFSEKIVATGITGATAMAVSPDGRVFVCEQTGALRVVKNDQLLVDPFVTVEVDSSWERGLIGVSLDPDFPAKPYVYLCYVSPTPYPHHRVSRF